MDERLKSKQYKTALHEKEHHIASINSICGPLWAYVKLTLYESTLHHKFTFGVKFLPLETDETVHCEQHMLGAFILLQCRTAVNDMCY